jgi:UDP-glucose 4-epimerase
MILITGASGFIGHSLVRSLSENYKLLCIDDFSNSEPDSISPYLGKIIFYEDDINNILESKYDQYLPQITHIIHTSCSQISKSIVNPFNDLQNNGFFTLKLLEFSRKLPNLKKFIYLSSVSIYGDNSSITEESHIDLHTPYSVSKYIGEKYVELYNKTYDIPYIILRLSNVYGYNQQPIHNRICGVIGKFLYNAVNNIPIEIYGDGEDFRDYTFIDDVTNIIEIMLNNEIINDHFNISTSSKTSINNLLFMISQYKQIQTTFLPKRDIDNILDRRAINDKITQIYPKFIGVKEGIEKILKKEYKYEM